MSIIFAFWVSMACNLAVFAMFLYVIARVTKFNKSLKGLDWQAVADITGDIGAVKRSIQRLNNRLNGLEKTASQPDALAELALIHQQAQQGNISPLVQPNQRATGG